MTGLAMLLGSSLPGCRFEHGTVIDMDIEDGSVDRTDAPLADARVDTPPNSTCFGTGLFVDCYGAGLVPVGAFIPTGQIDTGDPSSCTRIVPVASGPELCLKSAGTITISSYVRWKGPRPLVLLASDSITVTSGGTLDVSSFRADVGAGGNTGTCSDPANGGSDTGNGASSGAGGGGGGGFGTPGGSGGNGRGAGGGGAGGSSALALIRGGCKAASGGSSSDGAGGGGGNGGGAVYLIAGNSITIAGTVKANGSGGSGGPNKAGGGGGGSGGLIAFDAPNLTISGTVFANGGGAGEGGGGGFGGANGSDPMSYNIRAPGGGQNPNGGNGGGGSVFANSGQGGAAGNSGGGGGGGGAGRIKVFQAAVPMGSSFKISPPAQ